MATIEQRVTILETEFRTEIKHLATKADLIALEHRLTLRLGGVDDRGIWCRHRRSEALAVGVTDDGYDRRAC